MLVQGLVIVYLGLGVILRDKEKLKSPYMELLSPWYNQHVEDRLLEREARSRTSGRDKSKMPR